jgi:hypothetical protein
MSETYEDSAAEAFTMLRGIRIKRYLLVSHWDSRATIYRLCSETCLLRPLVAPQAGDQRK